MKVLSLCSSVINSKLKQENLHIVEGNSIINRLYIYEDDDKKCDYVIFDLLQILDDYIIYNNKIMPKTENINNIDKRKIKHISDNKEKIFVELINIVINELLKKYHISKIILLDLEIVESLNYKEYIQKSNNLIKAVTTKLIKDNPGLTISQSIKISYSDENKKFEIEDSILEKLNFDKFIYQNERVHRSLKNIRYYFQSAKVFNKNKLIVIFSAFSQSQPKYNYVKTLKTIDCNKLYILDDYGEKGSYYLGLDGNFDIESSVMSLITNIMKEKNILFNDVIAIGSSKGGSAAIYYGFKYNFREVIVGAPQYKIGTYLMDLSIKTYGKDVFGDLTEANRLKYDNLIRKVIPYNSNTKISILTSYGDNQYERVLKDIEMVLEQSNIDFIIDKCDINHHNEIAKSFTDYSYEKLTHSLNGKGCINNKLIKKINKIILKSTMGGTKWKDKGK